MRQLYFSAAAAMVGCSALLRPTVALGVINADNPGSATPDNEAQPAGLPEWNDVGQVGGGSGVYLGNGWVLTAYHVGAGNFNLDGTTYDWNGQPEIRLNNPGSEGPADLVMFQLQTTLAGGVSVASVTAPGGTPIYNVGYGLARNTAEEYFNYNSMTQTFTPTTNSLASYQGFGFGSSNIKSWGTNTIGGTTTYSIGYGYVDGFYSNFASNTDQIIYGDSGGGVFNDSGVLIGVNDALDFYTNQPSNTVLFGDDSDMIDIAPFYNQIMNIENAPEPSSMTLLALGGGALLGRRRRKAKREMA